jgi:hypothetical protein
MLKIISSKNESLVYSEVSKLKKKNGFLVASQSISFSQALAKVGDISIFSDKEVFLVNFKSEDVEMLENDINSGNLDLKIFAENDNLYVFIGSGVEFEKIFAGQKQEVIKLEEKKVFDFPADLITALQKGDKKNSWNLLLKELKEKEAEMVHGSCVFAYKSLMVYLNNPTKNSPTSGVKDFSWQQAKRNATAGKRGLQEVQDKYFNLLEIYHKARMGEGSLDRQLEIWVLGN